MPRRSQSVPPLRRVYSFKRRKHAHSLPRRVTCAARPLVARLLPPLHPQPLLRRPARLCRVGARSRARRLQARAAVPRRAERQRERVAWAQGGRGGSGGRRRGGGGGEGGERQGVRPVDRAARELDGQRGRGVGVVAQTAVAMLAERASGVRGRRALWWLSPRDLTTGADTIFCVCDEEGGGLRD